MKMWKNSKTEPNIKAERIDGTKIELDLQPEADLFQFKGHFPDEPILPGVGQLDWAVRYAKRYFSLSQDIAEINQLKFRDLMRPEIHVVLTLDYQKEKNRVLFSYANEESVFSSGILKLKTL